MSDPYNSDIGAADAPATMGRPTGFGENFASSLGLAAQNNNWLSLQGDVQSEWQNSLNALRARGIDVPENNPLRMAENLLDPNNQNTFERGFLGVNDTTPERQTAFQNAERLNDQIHALNDPAVQSIEQIIDHVKQVRGIREDDAGAIAQAATWMGKVGGVLGDIASMGTDPAQIPLNLIPGGIGKTVVTRLAAAVAMNAGIAGFVQGELVNPMRQEAGEQPDSVAEAALYGGAFGGLLHGAGEGLGYLASRALAKIQVETGPLNFEDAQLRSMFERHPDDPNARAGLAALDEKAHFEESNQYGDTSPGMRRFSDEQSAVIDAFGDTLNRSGTAIGRVLPDVSVDNLDNLDYHTEVVKTEQPELWDRLVAATQELSDIDAKIADTQHSIDNLSVSDALSKIDETTGDLVKSYEEELNNPNLSDSDRAALEQKIQGIVESVQATPTDLGPQIAVAEQKLTEATTKAEQLAAARELDKLHKQVGEDVLQRAMDQVTIPMKKELQALAASRRAANKAFKAARNTFDAAIERVKLMERLRESLKPQTPDPKQGPGGPIDVTALRGDRLQTKFNETDAAADALPKQNDALGERILKSTEEKPEPKEGQEPPPPELNPIVGEDGKIDFGDGVKYDPSFKVTSEDGGHTTVGEMFRRMQEDEKMLEAMRTCAL